jgi:hypothetical protein
MVGGVGGVKWKSVKASRMVLTPKGDSLNDSLGPRIVSDPVTARRKPTVRWVAFRSWLISRVAFEDHAVVVVLGMGDLTANGAANHRAANERW